MADTNSQWWVIADVAGWRKRIYLTHSEYQCVHGSGYLELLATCLPRDSLSYPVGDAGIPKTATAKKLLLKRNPNNEVYYEDQERRR